VLAYDRQGQHGSAGSPIDRQNFDIPLSLSQPAALYVFRSVHVTWNIHQSAMINVNTQLSSQTYIKQISRIWQ